MPLPDNRNIHKYLIYALDSKDNSYYWHFMGGGAHPVLLGKLPNSLEVKKIIGGGEFYINSDKVLQLYIGFSFGPNSSEEDKEQIQELEQTINLIMKNNYSSQKYEFHSKGLARGVPKDRFGMPFPLT
jgi:hypothetical protein